MKLVKRTLKPVRMRWRKFKEELVPIKDFIRVAPYLFKVRKDKELRSIFRSYLSWVPLCLFSEPLLWVRMLLTTRYRFRNSDQRPHSFYIPHLSASSFRAPNQLSKFLEENIESIRKEFRQIDHLEVETPSKSLVAKGTWNTFPLMRSATTVPDNINLCPETWTVAKQCPLLLGVRGGVYFSILYPGSRISSHCGPSNLKHRYHLTIEAAEGARIRSGNEWRSWSEGKCWILDDSFEHEVIHDGDRFLKIDFVIY